MSVVFDYTELYSLLVSDYQTTPTDFVFWRDIYNPGHAGTNLYLEAYMDGIPFTLQGGGGTWSWKVQYALLATPTTWVDLITDSGSAAGTSTLTVGLDDSETGNITMASNGGTFPSNGVVIIGAEALSYNAVSVNSLNILARGDGGTTPAAHSIGAAVTLASSSVATPLTEKNVVYIETSIINPLLLRLIGTSSVDMATKATSDIMSFRMVGTV
jgi:hypothetical protein